MILKTSHICLISMITFIHCSSKCSVPAAYSRRSQSLGQQTYHPEETSVQPQGTSQSLSVRAPRTSISRSSMTKYVKKPHHSLSGELICKSLLLFCLEKSVSHALNRCILIFDFAVFLHTALLQVPEKAEIFYITLTSVTGGGTSD